MSIIYSISILLILVLLVAYNTIKRSESFWAFVIFFQHIPLILFHRLGYEFLGFVFYVLAIAVFYIKNPTFYFKKQRILNPISISLFILMFALLVHYCILGISSDNVRGLEVFYRVFIFNVPIILLCIFVIPINNDALYKILDGTVVYGVLFLLTVILATGLADVGIIDRGTFRDDFRISPLAAAKTAGIISLAAILNIIKTKKFTYKLFYILVLCMAMMLMFITASRASIIFLIITVAIFIFISGNNIKFKIISLFTFILVTIVGFIIVSTLELSIVQRMQLLRDYDHMLRFVRIEIAYKIITNLEMGLAGLGPFGFGEYTGLNYPHNYIIELIIDYGLFGLISLLLLIGYGYFYSYILTSKMNNFAVYFVCITFIYLFLSTLTSGDIVYARHMQFCAILLGIIYSENKHY